MLINKYTKQIFTRSDMPNTNWLGKEWYVVKDNSMLAKKIEQLYPKFDFVLDDNGNLVDVVEVPKTQEEINSERVEEIKAELTELDNTINRATEDLYTLTKTIPYETIQQVIDKKIELRKELNALN